MDGRRPSTNKKKGLEASTEWRTSARVAFGDSETQLFGDAEAPPTTETLSLVVMAYDAIPISGCQLCNRIPYPQFDKCRYGSHPNEPLVNHRAIFPSSHEARTANLRASRKPSCWRSLSLRLCVGHWYRGDSATFRMMTVETSGFHSSHNFVSSISFSYVFENPTSRTNFNLRSPISILENHPKIRNVA
jgi:hypothetical protein